MTSNWRYISGDEDIRSFYRLGARSFYRLGARSYDATTGRFTQMDPTGQEPNPYTYAQNNPCNNIDPTGLATYGPDGDQTCRTTGVVFSAFSTVAIAAAPVSWGASAVLGLAFLTAATAGTEISCE